MTKSRAYVSALLILGAVVVSNVAGAETFVVSNTGASGSGSLRQAILSANATSDPDIIAFAIVGAGTQTIGGSLPSITKPVLIDGYTQPSSSVNTQTDGTTDANVRIRLDGASAHAGDAVLNITGGQVVLRGLVINNVKAGGAAIQVNPHVSGTTVIGCFVGTTPSGLGDSSTGTGILVEGSAIIGTPLPEDRNLISGNESGIVLAGSHSVVQNNLIGVDREGEPGIGNGTGVLLKTASSVLNLVGGSEPGSGNEIAGNVGAGIHAIAGAGSGNRFERNRIHDNGGLGIDLGPAGVTANDAGDADIGPNHLQNFPELEFARFNGTFLSVDGVLESKPGEYLVEFFTSVQADPSGFGEGAAYAGAVLVEVQEGKDAGSFAATVDLGVPGALPMLVTATAQSVEFEDTSEFSRPIEAIDGGAEILVINTADSGEGSLRAALEAANLEPDTNTVVFDIPGSGAHTIQPLTSLSVTQPVVIDAYTESGARQNTLAEGTNAALRIVVDGSKLETDTAAVDVVETGALIRGVVIHSAPHNGISAVSADGLRIEGSFIGTDVTGMQDLGNAENGIDTGFSLETRIGGVTRASRNLISGNTLRGILDRGQASEITGNLIGSNAAATGDLGNGLDGIRVAGSDATIGSDQAHAGNLIRGNGGDGIEVTTDAAGVEIRGNAFVANDGLGIDLLGQDGASGVTANDANDVDTTGGNALQNFPLLTSVTATAGKLEVEGSLDVPASASNRTYTIRMFASPACDPSAHGEGADFLGAADVVLSAGSESFDFELAVLLDDDVKVTATATDAVLGNTSEFSTCAAVVVPKVLCGDVSLDGNVAASDALLVLKAAVGSFSCLACICDANGSGTITSPDALLVLKAAVGQVVNLDCPPVCTL